MRVPMEPTSITIDVFADASVGDGVAVTVRTTRASRTSGAAGTSCRSFEARHRNVLAA